MTRMSIRLAATLMVFGTIGAACWWMFRASTDSIREANVPNTASGGTSADEEIRSTTRIAAPSRVERFGVVRPKGNPPEPLAFIRHLAMHAFEGDAEAQYLIARESMKCEETLSLMRKQRDPEAAFWRNSAAWPPALRTWTFDEWRRCKPLLDGDPFEELPPRDGGYPPRYWMERALASGRPVAVVDHELARLRGLVSDRGHRPGTDADRSAARDRIASALLSQDPDAPLMLGYKLLAYPEDELRIAGAAWMLVGCRTGGDCSERSAIVPMGACIAMGNAGCTTGMDVETYLAAQLGADVYARAYALHEELVGELRGRNLEAIEARLNKQTVINSNASD